MRSLWPMLMPGRPGSVPPSAFQSGRHQVHGVAQRGIHDLAVRIVGQDRAAGRGLRAVDDPVVAAQPGADLLELLQRARLIGLQRPAEVVRAFGDVEDRRRDLGQVEPRRHLELLLGKRRLQILHACDAERLDLERAHHLARRVARQRPARHPRQDGLRRPGRLRLEAQDLELHRHLLLVDRFLDRRVDPGGERLEDLAPFGVVPLELLVPVPAERQQPRELVAGHVLRAEHFGQPPLAVAPPHLELPHPILGDDEALREEEIRGGLRVDVRNAPGVAQHLDRARTVP